MRLPPFASLFPGVKLPAEMGLATSNAALLPFAAATVAMLYHSDTVAWTLKIEASKWIVICRHGVGSEEQIRRIGRDDGQRAAGRGAARRRGGGVHRAERVHPAVLEDPDVGIQRGCGKGDVD